MQVIRILLSIVILLLVITLFPHPISAITISPYTTLITTKTLTPTPIPIGVTPAAYFQFDYPPDPDTFIFKLTNPQIIQKMRSILAGGTTNKPIMGTVIKQSTPYNPGWSFYLDPNSIDTFDSAAEACDASIKYIEDHLDLVCNDLLPNCIWCPWGSRLLREVNYSPNPNISPGDSNADGFVDGFDYVIWLMHYKTIAQQPGNVTIGDFNSDLYIDGLDYKIWLTNYNKGSN